MRRLDFVAARSPAQVPVTHSESPQRSHGRIETRTLKVVTAHAKSDFPSRRIIQVIRERVTGTGERRGEVVYAICSLPFEQVRPALIAAWLRDHSTASSRFRCCWPCLARPTSCR